MNALDRLLAERACERLVMRYALAVNDWDLDAFTTLFTEDAVWRRPNVAPLTGHAQIRGFMESQPSDRTLRHVNGLCLVEVADDGASASAVSQTTVYATSPAGPLPARLVGPDMVVEYRDRIVRQDGRWLFARRDTTVVFGATGPGSGRA